MNRMDRMRARSRGFVLCNTKKYEKRCGLGFMVCMGLSFAIRKTCVAHMKVLSDLVILFLRRFYRHSGPIGPGVHPANPGHPGHPASDTETQQAHREKVWKTLMSIERKRNKEKRSVRTLIAIDTLEPIVFGGEGLSSCSSCASWPS